LKFSMWSPRVCHWLGRLPPELQPLHVASWSAAARLPLQQHFTRAWKLAAIQRPPLLGAAGSLPADRALRVGAPRRSWAAAAVGASTILTYFLAKSAPLRCEEATLAEKCTAEALGTGIVVHGGCGAVCSAKYCNSGLGAGPVALAWGLSVALAVYATRDVSGAHLNPAVTASLAVNKDFPKEEIAPYVAAQVLGATLAGAVNYLVCHRGIAQLESTQGLLRGTAASTASYNGAFGMVPNTVLVSPLAALVVEAWMTSVFAFLVYAATDSGNTVPSAAAPALIGASVAMLISVFGPVTGCGMNPARDLGPRLVTALLGWRSAALSSWWVYTLGPVVGAVLGGGLYQATLAGKG